VHSEHNATNMHFPASHRLYLGGNAHGTARVARWLEGADVVVAVGCDLFMEEHFDGAGIIPRAAASFKSTKTPRRATAIDLVDTAPVVLAVRRGHPHAALSLASRVATAVATSPEHYGRPPQGTPATKARLVTQRT